MVRQFLVLFAVVAACVAIVLGHARSALAQGSVEPGGSTRPEVQLPEAIDSVVPDYPADALGARVEATVVLRLTIDAGGTVTEVEVMESAGHSFDEAARTAALKARFIPARRGDTAVPSRILFRVDFRLPPRPPARLIEELHRAQPVTPEAHPLAPEAPIEVTVRGLSESDRRRESAEAVTVVDTERAKRETADIGEVLARTQGVGVRRAGGLGSVDRFSLHGLVDDEIRFLLDGIPLELAGFPFGFPASIVHVPVNFLERIEIYSGVVPVRFGTDALGGVVNVVTNRSLPGTHAAASYLTGSFDTHRLTVGVQRLDEPTGLFARANGFFDYAKNDYPIDVQVPDERGRLSPARVHRFHDAYRAAGGDVEVGVFDRAWAKRLLLRLFATDFHKQHQHNLIMSVPFGGVTYGESSTGGSLRYEQRLARGVFLESVAGYASTRGTFLDVATCVYDWFGRCVRERRQPGETDDRPHDQVYWDRSSFLRAHLGWRMHPDHALRLTVAPTNVTRTGDERRQSDPNARDPLSAERDLLTLVNGIEYEADFFDDRLENIAFAKHYVQGLDSEEPRPGGIFRRRDRDTQRFGVGDGLRYRFTPWLYAKASYEWATRLPRPDEVFGDNAFIVANLELEPETGHNANLELTLDAKRTPAGYFRARLLGFLRDTDQQIVLLGNDRVQSFQNVYSARSLGADGTVGWTSPKEFFEWDINATYAPLRNTSSEGTFGAFEGDIVPNRPWLFANYSARFQLRGVAAARDEVALTWYTRYVHEYFRSWASVGLREFKQVIPSQFVHTAGVGYLVRSDQVTLSSTLEVQNLTNEVVFDFFGVQRPGRAFYVKTTAEF